MFTADVEKMYRQVKVANEDQQYQRILWRFLPKQPIQEYNLTTVTYGLGPASYLAVKTLQQIAIEGKQEYSDALKIIQNDFYVDDLLSGASNTNEASRLQTALIALLKTGGCNLRKLSSNCPVLIEGLPQEIVDQTAYEFTTEMPKKSLGILWDPTTDTFSFKVQRCDSKFTTKRTILSEVSKLYDPISWLAPIITKAKSIIQKLWINGTDWDTPVDNGTQREWDSLCNNLHTIHQLKIDRWLQCNEDIELHGFSDASEAAYGAVIYGKTTRNGKVSITLLHAKSKVAPVKCKATLPKLELCAAELLAKLLTKTKGAMQMNITATYAWTDSMITLAWIKSDANRWRTFTANRVSNIQRHSHAVNWRYIPTKENPADIISRGMHASELVKNTLWWKGPTAIQKDEIYWPGQPKIDQTEEEIKRVHTITLKENVTLSRFSTLQRMVRILPYCR